MSLPILYTPLDWSFISIQFFFLNFDSWSGATNLLFFDITLLYYYTNLNSSIICCLFSGDMYLSFGTCISSFCSSLEDFFEKFTILSALLLPIKSPVASAVFWIALFEAVFIASVADCLALSRSFWPYL